MSTTDLEKLSSQAVPEVLGVLRKIAEAEGRSIEAVLEEALRNILNVKKKDNRLILSWKLLYRV